MRPSGRAADQLREIKIEPNALSWAEGSCLVSFGKTRVLCAATVDEKAPPFLRNSGLGWTTAEYSMLPRATHSRGRRERNGASGRTQEIQRLIGRSLRAALDRPAMGERQIIVDCDVIEADGGTRTASITGGWVALSLAARAMVRAGIVKETFIATPIAAVSCGIVDGVPVLDLDYQEDSSAGADANFVMTGDGKLVEAQASAEGATFARAEFDALLNLAEKGVAELVALQRAALEAA